MQENPEFIESFSSLGRSSDVPEDLVISLNRFVCLLYGDKMSTGVDDCRYVFVLILSILLIYLIFI